MSWSMAHFQQFLKMSLSYVPNLLSYFADRQTFAFNKTDLFLRVSCYKCKTQWNKQTCFYLISPPVPTFPHHNLTPPHQSCSDVVSALCHLVVFFKINEWHYHRAELPPADPPSDSPLESTDTSSPSFCKPTVCLNHRCCSVLCCHDSMWFLGWDGNGKPLQCNAAIQKWAGERFNVILQNYLLF